MQKSGERERRETEILKSQTVKVEAGREKVFNARNFTGKGERFYVGISVVDVRGCVIYLIQLYALIS